MTALASVQGPACLWGFYSDQDWQRSLHGLAGYDALDALVGKAQSCTCPQLSWAWGTNADGTPIYQPFYAPRLDADRQKGRIPVMTWMSMNGGDRSNPAMVTLFNNESILAGKHDGYITQFARDAAAWGHKFIVRFDPEMNGWWEGPFAEYGSNNLLQFGNTDGSFVRMWQYVVAKVRPIAPNILWYWCANPLSSASGNPTYVGKLPHFYPGDAWTDFVGYDVYNKASAGPNSPWRTFRECLEGGPNGWPPNSLAPLLALAPGKPWILGEVGCAAGTVGDTTPGAGDRARWISDMFDALRTRYPFIKLVQWFNVAPYSIDAAAAQGFTRGTAYPNFPAAPLPDLDAMIYDVIGTTGQDQTIAQLQTQLQQAQTSLQTAQTQLATVQTQLQQAQATDTADQTQIATLKTQLSDAATAAQTAAQHASACETAMQAAQQHLTGLLSFAQAPLP